MPNWEEQTLDYRSRFASFREQYEEARERVEKDKREDKMQGYIDNHPDASWAEADYNTR